MPKILVKGGIWKNTEDEILKVAVMKYGKNQWNRIASLLHRKTAKQCKARWYEWLDPGIKKTDWTREEEEKLLHLAKLMPTQWRTIAPMVGRTANQCLERYEYLLDQAQVVESGLIEADDPRKLRPGEVDPNPETKPARPDPVDMDEDEMEMLSEARARLANTQGKKAKRKAREKQLDEARRLATLQKKRELRSAGCNLILLNKIKRCCDLNFEVPFEKKAAPGFFDTSTEKIDPNSEEFKELRLREYTRRDRTEILERKRDKEKFEKMKESDLLNVLKKTAPQITVRRSKLVLPSPQVSQAELEEVVKLGAEAEMAKKLVSNDAINFPTNSLLQDYAMTPLSTNESGMRTPITPGSQSTLRTPMPNDILMKEAQTILALNKTETPLKGGTNIPIPEAELNMTSSKPNTQPVHTPNTVLTTPYSTPGNRSGQGDKEYTPLRDSLNINKDSNYSSASSTPLNSKIRSEFHDKIRKQFSSLPQPREINIDQFEIEKLEEKISDTSVDVIPDAGEEELRQQKLRKLEEMKKETLIPESIKYNLPIPSNISDNISLDSCLGYSDKILKKAENLVFQESNNFIKKVIALKEIKYVSDFEPEQIEAARNLLLNEMSNINIGNAHFSKFSKIWNKCHNMKNEYIHINKNDPVIQNKITKEIHNNEIIMNKNEKTIKKLLDKIKIIYGGYAQRSEKLLAQINEFVGKNAQINLELHAFHELQKQETIAGNKRLSDAQRHLDDVKKTEEHLQRIVTELTRSS